MWHNACSVCINIVPNLSYDKCIRALLLAISNVVHNVDQSVALHLELCGRIFAVIALPLCNTHLLINVFVHCC